MELGRVGLSEQGKGGWAEQGGEGGQGRANRVGMAVYFRWHPFKCRGCGGRDLQTGQVGVGYSG